MKVHRGNGNDIIDAVNGIDGQVVRITTPPGPEAPTAGSAGVTWSDGVTRAMARLTAAQASEQATAVSQTALDRQAGRRFHTAAPVGPIYAATSVTATTEAIGTTWGSAAADAWRFTLQGTPDTITVPAVAVAASITALGPPSGPSAELVAAGGGRVAHVSADLTDPAAPAALVDAARAAFGHLDAVVANHARSSRQALEQLTAAEIDLSYAVNTRASLLLVQALAAQHDGRLGGRVVLFTSGQYHGAMPDELPYIAFKGALHQLTPSLAVHLAPRGITVNCLDPGPTDTGYADDAQRAAVAAASPSGRWSTPEDAARLIAWLLSDDASWVTGQVIASDGGWSSR